MIVYEWPIDARRRYPNFSQTEMTCQCGCGALPDPEFMDQLQLIRSDCGFVLPVTSGARCGRWNMKKSPKTGATGPHTTGLAADIQCSGHVAYEFIAAALERAMTGIGIHQKGPHSSRYSHIDSLPESGKRPWIWSYP